MPGPGPDARPVSTPPAVRAAFAGVLLVAAFLVLRRPAPTPPAPAPPRPPSPVIAGLDFDFTTVERRAPGSDNWPTTWADDGHLYTAWGDGGGFGGSNTRGRVSLGVARVEGPGDAYVGRNVWGGVRAPRAATFGGKSYGILSLDGALYLWVSPGSGPDNFLEARLHMSRDRARTWTAAAWAFEKADGIILPTFCQFGRDHAGARDEHVYAYAPRLRDDSGLVIQRPGAIDLLRAPADRLLDRDAWAFFAGLDADGRPRWTTAAAERRPVLEDPAGTGWNVSAVHHPRLDRYLLCTEHGRSHAGNLGVFDAAEPWGPFTTVAYEQAWGDLGRIFFWSFPSKWLEPDGRFVMVFTGSGVNDAWRTVRGRFLPGPGPPGQPDPR